MIVALILDLPRQRLALAEPLSAAIAIAIGFVTNFFDTLGIGSFATTTSLFKFLRFVPDERIPGTLNVGHALPTIVEAAIFIVIVAVEPPTLSAADSWPRSSARGSAPVSSHVCRGATCRSAWAVALVVAAVLFILSNLQGSHSA